MTRSPLSNEEKSISLQKAVDIPRKPKAPKPVPPTLPETISDNAGVKRKLEETEIEQEDADVKRIQTNNAPNGEDGTQPIVLDEVDGGAILIDD